MKRMSDEFSLLRGRFGSMMKKLENIIIHAGLHRWIHLEVVNSGCVCFTCSAPARLEGVLIQMAKQRQKEAMKMKVFLLQVGETVIN